MNLRNITENYEDTLITLEKIFKEYEYEPVSSKLNQLNKSIQSKELIDDNLKFLSAFENGAEIGVLVTKGNEICALSIKKYAQKRGVGKALIDSYISQLKDGSKLLVQIEPEFEPFYSDLGFNRVSDEINNYDGIDYLTMEYVKNPD